MKTIFALLAILIAATPANAGPNHDRPEFKKLGPQAPEQPSQPQTPAPVTPGAPTTGN